jgi:hypothetical protein
MQDLEVDAIEGEEPSVAFGQSTSLEHSVTRFGLPLRVPYTHPSRFLPLNSRVNPFSPSWASGAPGAARNASQPARTSPCRALILTMYPPCRSCVGRLAVIIAASGNFGFLPADITLCRDRLVLQG